MNKEQLAALIVGERQLAEAAQLDPGKVFAGEDVLPVLTALADARLELQQAKDSRDGFACDLNHAEDERDQQREDIARLTAAVEAAQPPDGDCPHGYFVGRDCPEGCTDDEGHNLLREDIERLMECGRALADHVHTEYDANCVKADKMLRVLLDLKGRYDA